MKRTFLRAITNDSPHTVILEPTGSQPDRGQETSGQENKSQKQGCEENGCHISPLQVSVFERQKIQIPRVQKASGEHPCKVLIGQSTWYIGQSGESIVIDSSADLLAGSPLPGIGTQSEDIGLIVDAAGNLRAYDWLKMGVAQRTRIEPVGQPAPGHAVMYETSEGSGQALKRTEVAFDKEPNKAFWQTIEIDAGQPRQTLVGFGGAFTDAATLTVEKMPAKTQDTFLNAYFGPNGIGYSVARIPIGSNDFCAKGFYSYDDTADDFTLSDFKLKTFDQQSRIPLIKRANALKAEPLKLLASPWTAPPWMKEGGTQGGWVGGKLKSDAKYHHAWALYFAKFFDAYGTAGLNFWGCTVQNEPSGLVEWESMSFTIEEQAAFIKDHLGPVLRKVHPKIKILCYEDQKSGYFNGNMPADPLHLLGLLKASGAEDLVDGIAFHWYRKAIEFAPTWNPPGDPWCAGSLEQTRAELVAQGLEDKILFATEACEGFEKGQQQGPAKDVAEKWNRAIAYAHDILTDLNHWTAGWLDWNLVLDMQGGPNHVGNYCDSPMLYDESTDTLHLQPMFYYLAHFSKFIAPGSIGIQATSRSTVKSAAPMECTAFKTPGGEIIVVVQNADITAHKYWISVKNRGYLNISVEPHSIQTFVIA